MCVCVCVFAFTATFQSFPFFIILCCCHWFTRIRCRFSMCACCRVREIQRRRIKCNSLRSTSRLIRWNYWNFHSTPVANSIHNQSLWQTHFLCPALPLSGSASLPSTIARHCLYYIAEFVCLTQTSEISCILVCLVDLWITFGTITLLSSPPTGCYIASRRCLLDLTRQTSSAPISISFPACDSLSCVAMCCNRCTEKIIRPFFGICKN